MVRDFCQDSYSFRSVNELLAMLLTVTFGFFLCSTAHCQSVVVFSIPKSRESIDQKAELRYCSQWLNFVGGNDARVDLLLELLDKDSLDVPYRWRSAFDASKDADNQWPEGGGITAPIVLPIRRKQISDDLGEVLLLKKKLTIRLPESHGPGGGYRVPSAVLDQDDCYIIDSQQNSRIVLTKLETTAGTKRWEVTIPLFYSHGQGTGPGYNDGFQDIRFLDRGGKRVLQSWNHYAGEFMFVELDCSDGSIETWFSSKIKDHMNIR